MKTSRLHRKQRDSRALVKQDTWKRFSAHFCLLVLSKTSQTLQLTRGGIFLCCDFTLCSSVRCLKNASDKYWMSKRQHDSFPMLGDIQASAALWK